MLDRPFTDLASESDPSWLLPRAMRALHVGRDLRQIGSLFGRRLGLKRAAAAGGRDDLAASPAPTAPRSATPRRRGGPTVLQYLDLPDKRIDLARGAILIAREDDPSIDEDAVLDRLDQLADSIRTKIRQAAPGHERIAVLNRFIFDDLGIQADRNPPRLARRLESLHLHLVLDHRRGHCLGLSLLYLSLGHRLDLPLFGVALPRHFFVRWEDEDRVVNIETTSRGEEIGDHQYATRYGLSREHVDGGIYLGNLARREVLVEVLNNRGNFYWDRGQIDRSLRDLDRATRAGQNFARGFTGRGFIHLRRWDIPRAIAELRKALELDPDYAPAYLHLGEAYLRAGLLDRAATAFRRAIETSGRLALARTNLGRVKSKMGDVEGALREHQVAIELDRQCVHAWNNAGVAFGNLGRRDEALAHFRQALAMAPDFIPARENLAHLLRVSGRPTRAAIARRAVVKSYRKKVARSPRRASPLFALARFLLEYGREADLREAAGAAERAAALRPDDADGLATLAEIHYRLGNLPRALRVAERICALGSERLLGNEKHYRAVHTRYREAVETVLGRGAGPSGSARRRPAGG